jgi:hypothetical protein
MFICVLFSRIPGLPPADQSSRLFYITPADHDQSPCLFYIPGSHAEELEHSGLARQVSLLLTNHLARATECSGNEAAGREALQEVLSLLNNLSRSRMGKAILSQPACVSKLLSLLLDQR